MNLRKDHYRANKVLLPIRVSVFVDVLVRRGLLVCRSAHRANDRYRLDRGKSFAKTLLARLAIGLVVAFRMRKQTSLGIGVS